MADMEDIAYLSNLTGIVRVPQDDPATPGNIPMFGTSGAILDSDVSAEGLSSGLAAGAEALARDKIVIAQGRVTAEKPDGTGSVDLATSEELENKADLSAIDHEYDTSTHGYLTGETCTHDGKWYRCTISVAAGSEWSENRWEEINVNDRLSDFSRNNQADWTQDDTSAASYIRHKPEIPVIDDTLENEGEAADAKVVGDRLSAIEDAIGGTQPPAEDASCSYDIVDLVPVQDEDDTVLAYQILNRTVNVITASVPYGRTIKLLPPNAAQDDSGAYLAREFLVSVSITSESGVPISMPSMSLKTYDGKEAALSAIPNRRVTYKFIDIDENQSVFLVSMFADPAYSKIIELESALDAMLEDGGYGSGMADFVPGVYLYDESEHLFHRATAIKDPETGGWNVAVDNDGIDRGPPLSELAGDD